MPAGEESDGTVKPAEGERGVPGLAKRLRVLLPLAIQIRLAPSMAMAVGALRPPELAAITPRYEPEGLVSSTGGEPEPMVHTSPRWSTARAMLSPGSVLEVTGLPSPFSSLVPPVPSTIQML